MRLPVEAMHTIQIKQGVNRCIKCNKVDPDLKQPCPKSGACAEPAGAGKK